MWDLISSEEAVLLTAAHSMHANHPPISKKTLAKLFPQVLAEDRPYPAEDMPGTTLKNSHGSWVFKDDNPAVHLIRNAVGYGDQWLMRLFLSMNDGLVRSVRDDISVV